MDARKESHPNADYVVPVIELAQAPGAKAVWGRSRAVVYAWGVVEGLFVTNPWQVSSAIRVWALRLFGAHIGQNVIFRPRTRVRFPWKLTVGDGSWIGEGVWLHNQDFVTIGRDAVISQEAFITTGSHAHRKDMALLTRPIEIKDGAWITSRVTILGGSTIGRSALVTPNSVVGPNQTVAANAILTGNPAVFVEHRFEVEGNHDGSESD